MSAPKLTYTLHTTPTTLHTGKPGAMTITCRNESQQSIIVRSITVSIPTGDRPAGLTTDPLSITAPRPRAGIKVDGPVKDTTDQKDQRHTYTYRNDLGANKNITIQGNAQLVLELKDIKIHQATGDCVVQVTERDKDNTAASTIPFTVTKYPEQFSIKSFGTNTATVERNGKAVVSWKAAGALGQAIYYQQLAHDKKLTKVSLGNAVEQWETPRLTFNTPVVLELTGAATGGGTTVTYRAHVYISVIGGDIIAGDLEVQKAVKALKTNPVSYEGTYPEEAVGKGSNDKIAACTFTSTDTDGFLCIHVKEATSAGAQILKVSIPASKPMNENHVPKPAIINLKVGNVVSLPLAKGTPLTVSPNEPEDDQKSETNIIFRYYWFPFGAAATVSIAKKYYETNTAGPREDVS